MVGEKKNKIKEFLLSNGCELQIGTRPGYSRALDIFRLVLATFRSRSSYSKVTFRACDHAHPG